MSDKIPRDCLYGIFMEVIEMIIFMIENYNKNHITMGNCFNNNKTDLFKKQQLKAEYYNKKVSINKLGTYKPHSVYTDDNNIVKGLNSMCNYNIHIAIADKPLRLILSYLNNSNDPANND